MKLLDVIIGPPNAPVPQRCKEKYRQKLIENSAIKVYKQLKHIISHEVYLEQPKFLQSIQKSFRVPLFPIMKNKFFMNNFSLCRK